MGRAAVLGVGWAEADSEEEVTGEGEASEGAAMVAAGQWKERGERADMSEQS